MLHIITPLFRFNLINHSYNSIPKYTDITWHISKSNKREELNCDFLNDNRVKVYNIDCDDTNTTEKRNAVLTKIKDGYFCFLDDDTIFHQNMYSTYLKFKKNNFNGMIIGQQLNYVGKLRLKASVPRFCGIDTGNVLCHTSCLKKVRWPGKIIPKGTARDYLFWNEVYNYYDNNAILINIPISHYNKLRKYKKI